MKKPWEKENKLQIDEVYKKRKDWQNIFIKKYGDPVIVHSTHNLNSFLNIIETGKIKIPKNHKFPKMVPLMERFLDFHDSIYLSLGFIYPISFNWKHAFIFKLDFLKELEYYKKGIHYRAYLTFIDYLFRNDKKTFNIGLKQPEGLEWSVSDLESFF